MSMINFSALKNVVLAMTVVVSFISSPAFALSPTDQHATIYDTNFYAIPTPPRPLNSQKYTAGALRSLNVHQIQ